MDVAEPVPMTARSAAIASPAGRSGWIFRSGIIFLAYVAVAQIGYILFTPPAVVTPAAGVALALLYIYGIDYAPVIFAAAIGSYVLNGASAGAVIALPLAQALQAALGAYVLRKLGFSVFLNKLGDVLALIFVSFTVSAIVPTFGLLSGYLNEHYFAHPASPVTWGTWWVGMITSILIMGAFTIRWAGKPSMHRRSALAYGEAIISLALVAFLSYLVFWTHITTVIHVSLVYVLLLPLFWLALRVGPRYTTLALLVTTGIAVTGTFFGVSSNLSAALLGARLFQIEIFLVIIACIFFILVVVEEERKETLAALKARVGDLQIALDTLHSQDRIKSEFLSVLAHELRNPLSPLVSSLEVLKLKGLINEEGSGMVQIMESQLSRLRYLLDELLDIARISQQKLADQATPVDVNRMLVNSLQADLFEPVEQLPAREWEPGGYRVLVVDDNEMAAKGMATLLGLKGYIAEVAHTGADARAAAAPFDPDAIILDIGLPDTDGYALARYFREEAGFKGLLIALTGYGQEENKRRAYDAGFDHHLTKPVGIADLQELLVAGLKGESMP